MYSLKDLASLYWGLILFAWLAILRLLAQPLGLRSVYNRLLVRLVGRVSLFDEEFYLEHNHDVAAAGCDPLLHYVAHGDHERRAPLAVFDPAFYRQQVRGWLHGGNSLLHYALVGRYLAISPSPWFDVSFYQTRNLDVARAGMDPLLHYLKYGGGEGRSPCANFDSAFYLQNNPDVAESRVNPLLHYLKFGRLEGRATLPESQDGDEGAGEHAVPCAERPEDSEWATLLAGHASGQAVVDVIVPVYRGRIETLRCLYSVLASRNKTPFELVVINDDSPDPELVADLKRLAARGLFTLLENEVNRGFVPTVNRGMALHGERDVLLLNSDAEVYGDWLDRLQQAAVRHAHTGTVTPLSNNATICSYPHFLHDNPYPLELSYESLDALAAKANAEFEVEAPTAVGFCMYIRRDCLDDVGLFDERAFGKGYGEENDFCQRAIARQWRNIIVANVFVRHWGNASFKGEKAKRVQAALKVLDKRYPDYRKDVDRFIKQDALAIARRQLDWSRLEMCVRTENVLIVCHNRGGGSERHVQEDTRKLLASGSGVFFLRPKKGWPTHARLSHPNCKSLPNLEPFRLSDTQALKAVLQRLKITRVHAHGLVDFTHDAATHLNTLVDELGVPLWVDIHDYKVICPRINLASRDGRYCGEPDNEEKCNRCLLVEGNDFWARDIGEWRERHYQVLKVAEKVFVPDQDVADRLVRYFPEINYQVAPHEDVDQAESNIRVPAVAPDNYLRIVVIGAISRIKGYDILIACARDARKRRLPLEFCVLGYSLDDRALEQAGVAVTGRYLEREAEEKLHALAPHAVWLPSMWPETYSYTLSLALKGGYPVVGFDIGAIAARLRRLNQADLLVPLELSSRPQELNDFFLAQMEKFEACGQVS